MTAAALPDFLDGVIAVERHDLFTQEKAGNFRDDDPDDAESIAWFARQNAELDALARTVARWRTLHSQFTYDKSGRPISVVAWAQWSAVNDVLLDLAQPYAGRDGWQKEWERT